MKKIPLVGLLLIINILNANAYLPRCYYAQFNLIDYTNSSFAMELVTFYNLGSGSIGPRLVGVNNFQSHDTVFIHAFHDVRGKFPTASSVMIDTLVCRPIPSGVKYINVSYNEITYDSLNPIGGDTVFNVFDMNFTEYSNGIDKIVNMYDFKVYPNPTTDGTINVMFSSVKPVVNLEIRIIDAAGRILLSKYYFRSNKIYQHLYIDRSIKGIYFLEAVCDGQNIVRSILLE